MAEEVVDKENAQENKEGDNNRMEQKLAELERMLGDKESEIVGLKKSEDELRGQLSAVNKSLAEAVSFYKSKVVQFNPDVTEELIAGDTIEAIDESLAKALNLVGRIKESVEKDISHIRVPAGAPERRSSDLSSLSPREKIQYAIGGKR
ncbi:MAG: hypothetical protein JW856_01840 [Dehalococcoidales bacterium]|nr:hypothetical protein [Dehalococcoidales bacterium]